MERIIERRNGMWRAVVTKGGRVGVATKQKREDAIAAAERGMHAS